MICPKCGVELRIAGCETLVTGDNAADTPTRVVLRQSLRCPNPACSQQAPVQVEHVIYAAQ